MPKRKLKKKFDFDSALMFASMGTLILEALILFIGFDFLTSRVLIEIALLFIIGGFKWL